MTQKEFAGDIAYDWELWVGREPVPGAGGHVFTQIYGFESLPFPDQMPEDQDVSHMQSPGRTRESTPGMLPAVDFSQEKQFWKGDPGDIILDALAALTFAGTKENVLIEFNLDPAGNSSRRTYRGYVNSYTPTGTVGEKIMANLSAKLLDRQPANARVIAT